MRNKILGRLDVGYFKFSFLVCFFERNLWMVVYKEWCVSKLKVI